MHIIAYITVLMYFVSVLFLIHLLIFFIVLVTIQYIWILHPKKLLTLIL